MAVLTAKESGSAKTAKTWTPEEEPKSTSELVIPTGIEVKFDTTITVAKLETTGGAKLNLTKGLTIGGAGNSLKLSSETVVSVTSVGKFNLSPPSTSTTEPITGGKDLVSLTIAGTATSKIKLTEKLTASTGLTLKGGLLTTANQEISCGFFNFEAATTKELILGSSIIKCTGTGEAWAAGTGFGLTIKAETSTIELTNESATFLGAGFTYNVVKFTGKIVTIRPGGCTIPTLELLLTGTEAEREVNFELGSVLTFTTMTKASGTIKFNSSSAGSAYKLKKASGTLTVKQVLLKDSTAEGGATFVDVKTASETTNISGNTGWTFENEAPTTAAGSSQASFKASATTGTKAMGAAVAKLSLKSTAAAPLPGVLTAVKSGKASEPATWSPAEAPTIASTLVIGGSLEVKVDTALQVIQVETKEKAKLALSKALTLSGSGNSLILGSETSVSVSGGGRFILNPPAATTTEPLTRGVDVKTLTLSGISSSKYKLSEPLTASVELLHKVGKLSTENNNMSVGTYQFESATGKELNAGTSIIKITANSGTFGAIAGVGLTLNASEASFELTGTTSEISLANFTYGTVIFRGEKAKIVNGLVNELGLIATLNLALTGSEREASVEAGGTLIVGTLTKSTGALTLRATGAGTPFKLKKATGTLTLSEATTIKDCTAEGEGIPFFATTDGGGNTNWTFAIIRTAACTATLALVGAAASGQKQPTAGASKVTIGQAASLSRRDAARGTAKVLLELRPASSVESVAVRAQSATTFVATGPTVRRAAVGLTTPFRFAPQLETTRRVATSGKATVAFRESVSALAGGEVICRGKASLSFAAKAPYAAKTATPMRTTLTFTDSMTALAIARLYTNGTTPLKFATTTKYAIRASITAVAEFAFPESATTATVIGTQGKTGLRVRQTGNAQELVYFVAEEPGEIAPHSRSGVSTRLGF